MMSQRTVLENSAAAADLACQLERREILQRNDLYPESVQVWVESHRHDTSHPHRHAHAHAHGSPITGRVPPRRVCGYWLSWPRDDHVHDLRGAVVRGGDGGARCHSVGHAGGGEAQQRRARFDQGGAIPHHNGAKVPQVRHRHGKEWRLRPHALR